MNIDDVQEEIRNKLRGALDRLNVYVYAKESVTPPAAIVMLPERVKYDETFGRGSDRITLDIVFLTGRVDADAAHREAKAYANPSGSRSVKRALENPALVWRSLDAITVTDCEFEAYPVAGIDYLATVFHTDIFGPGAAP